jgi:nucleotide-binding universal stress UspA family protein
VAGPIVVCADGSDLSNRAAAAGLARLKGDGPVIVVTVAEAADPTLVTGTGMAGGVMSNEELGELDAQLEQGGVDVLQGVLAALSGLGVTDVDTRVLRGDPGPSICAFAEEVSAATIVIGSRGRGGMKRAFLGSVSDFVVRNAPCPVLVTGDSD